MKLKLDAPKVSIVSITYNQEDYVRQMLDGFMMQKTNFTFEIVIADDCSTDKTQAIIEQYAEKYPSIFRLILRKNNIGAIPSLMDAIQKTKGAYIALCEGDDYWTDEHKLQKQVDLMDKHPEYALCFHPVKVIFDGSKESSIFPSRKNLFNIENLLDANFIQTNSVLYRRHDYKELATDVMPGDWYLHLFHARFGKIGFIDEVMSVYRRHSKGLWWNSGKDAESIWRKYSSGFMALYSNFLKDYGHNDLYRAIILGHVEEVLQAHMKADERNHTMQTSELIAKFPSVINSVVLHQSKVIKMNQELADDLSRQCSAAEARSDLCEHELSEIKASKVWRMLVKYRSFKDNLVKRKRYNKGRHDKKSS